MIRTKIESKRKTKKRPESSVIRRVKTKIFKVLGNVSKVYLLLVQSSKPTFVNFVCHCVQIFIVGTG